MKVQVLIFSYLLISLIVCVSLLVTPNSRDPIRWPIIYLETVSSTTDSRFRFRVVSAKGITSLQLRRRVRWLGSIYKI